LLASSVASAQFRVVALGDSFASGQGVPDEEFKWWSFWDTPRWEDERCRRSLSAPTHQAVQRLQEQGLSVEYASLACSGATIAKGLIGPYKGPGIFGDISPLPAQVQALDALASMSGVDVVTISIGGNDILFQYIVLACMTTSSGEIRARLSCELFADPICELGEPVFDFELAKLRNELDLLADRLADIPVAANHILLLEYPNPTQDSDGSYCDEEPPDDPLAGLDAEEVAWAAEYVLPRLNGELCLAARRHGWTFVDGIAVRFEGHGWCAESARWVNTINESWIKQRDHRGALHPNATGYRVVGDRLADVIAPLLAGQPPPTAVECPAIPDP
jgi:lysophospholipase L1-like esterase